MPTDHYPDSFATADTIVFKGGVLSLVPDLRDTVRIVRPLPPVPAPSTRRPAVTGMDPAGRRVTMITDRIPPRPTARARAIGYGLVVALSGLFGALWADDVTQAMARGFINLAGGAQ